MKTFDLVIIGGGAAAFAAAIRANELKARTAMVNAGLPLGGTCVNVGCVPTKRLLRASEILHLTRNPKVSSLELTVKKFDFGAIIEDQLALVRRMRQAKYVDVLARLANVTLLEGRGRFVSPGEVRVNGQILRANRMVVATGSKALLPPIEGIRDTGYVTHVEILKRRHLPGELIVIGAGPVGIEFAQMFARFGSRVTIVKRSPGILRFAEPQLTRRLAKILEAEGIDIITAEAFRHSRKEGGKKILTLFADGREREVAADEILSATGKRPNTKGLGLDAAGVEVDARQAIVVDAALQTSQPHIFAAGDVIDQPARFEPTAGREGTLAAGNALTGATDGIDYDTVPYTVFSDPQLAGVGLTEADQVRRAPATAGRFPSNRSRGPFS
jgi:mercuric reductase